MITLVMGCFVVSQNTNCTSPVSESFLLGSVCVAEAITTPTSWTLQEPTGTIPSKELLIIISLTTLFLSKHLFLSIKRLDRGLTWLQRRKIRVRSGPAPANIFLPYLFATHGL